MVRSNQSNFFQTNGLHAELAPASGLGAQPGPVSKVIIGLSLREADCQTRWLLRTALSAAHPGDIEIDVVNPSSEDRNRLSGFFVGLGRVVKYESIDNFLGGRADT
jgi:hypothetical protein